MGLDFRRKSGRIFDGSRLIPLGEGIKTSKVFQNTFSMKRKAYDPDPILPSPTPNPSITPTTTPPPTPTPPITPTISVTPPITPTITPTNTPTQTPPVTPTPTCACYTYTIENINPSGSGTYFYYVCPNGLVDTITVTAGNTATVCSISTPTKSTGSTLIVTKIGNCC
jgi:hypothetical protein